MKGSNPVELTRLIVGWVFINCCSCMVKLGLLLASKLRNNSVIKIKYLIGFPFSYKIIIFYLKLNLK